MAKTRDFLTWTDDEVELLLRVTQEYKAAKAAENVNWESVQSKYSDVFDRYLEQYPSPQEAMAMGKEFPHKKDGISKAQLTTKLKAVRIRYRQAVEAGRKSGHGRVILLFFDLCKAIWGGSPATQAIPEGIETVDMAVDAVEPTASPADSGSTSASGGGDAPETVATRRSKLQASMPGHRREILKRKLSLYSIAQEELTIKRRLLHRLEATDEEFIQTMRQWSSTMDRLNSSIEVLVQHIVGSGPSQYIPPPSPHPSIILKKEDDFPDT